MEHKVYYIKGSKENPEGVKQALLAVYPNVKNIDSYTFTQASHYHYVIDDFACYAYDLYHIKLLKYIGIELQPIAIEKKTKFRLPTKEDFKNLQKHFSKWNEEDESLEILNKDGFMLTLPTTGYYGSCLTVFDSIGYYWSSTAHDSDNAYCLCFDSCDRCVGYYFTSDKHAVRLVSDEPFEGGIEFNGVYWKPENEDGYYSYIEALEKFSKVEI